MPVTVREGSADGAAMAHLGIAHVGRRVRQQWRVLLEQRIDFEVAVTRQRPDAEVVAVFFDVAEIGETADVDDHRG
jgi:hypothetical protein